MSEPTESPNPFATPQAEVENPRKKERPPLASLGQRLAGYLFDQLIHTAAMLLWLLASGDLGTFVELATATSDAEIEQLVESISPAGLLGIGLISSLYVFIQLYLVFSARQTIGKRIVGSRIHRVDGSWANPWRILLLRGFVPFLLYLIPVIGFFAVVLGHLLIFGRESRCLHDLIADTVVLEA